MDKKPPDPNHPLIRGINASLEKTGLSKRAFSLKAGLAAPYVAGLLRGEQSLNVGQATIDKLAQAAGEDREFFGSSAPERSVELDDRYPSRPQAIIILREKKYPKWALDALGVEAYKSPTDPGLEHWLARGQEIAETGGKVREWANEAAERKPDMSELTAKPRRRGKK